MVLRRRVARADSRSCSARAGGVKARIAAESFRRGARVTDVARAHGATRGQIYQWRALARLGALALPGDDAAPFDFVSVMVEPENVVFRRSHRLVSSF